MNHLVFSISNETLVMNGKSYKAKSGPYSNGALPIGIYLVGGIVRLDTKTCSEGFIFRNSISDLAFWIPLTPSFDTERMGLGIHPDGNLLGTLGCIGLRERESINFYLDYMELEIKPTKLIVME